MPNLAKTAAKPQVLHLCYGLLQHLSERTEYTINLQTSLKPSKRYYYSHVTIRKQESDRAVTAPLRSLEECSKWGRNLDSQTRICKEESWKDCRPVVQRRGAGCPDSADSSLCYRLVRNLLTNPNHSPCFQPRGLAALL